MTAKKPATPEWATLAVLAFCYLGLMGATTLVAPVSLWLAIPVTAFFVALHSSLQHEALHGHPTRHALLNEALVFPSVGLFIPYRRFRDLHIAHHHDDILTDPYADPESNFMDPADWARLPRWVQAVYRANNTLLGRVVLGPGLSVIALVKADIGGKGAAQTGVLGAWMLYLLGLGPVLWWLMSVGTIPLWAYVVSAYFGFGLLKIRTYLEHRANENPAARTVVIEDRGPLSFLFLNNNFHTVHHNHPGAPWYILPGLYFADRQKYLALNGGYRYQNYREVFSKYLFCAKDPVPHPLRENARAGKSPST